MTPTRTFDACSKCTFEEASVSFHGVDGCTPLGSNNPCWDAHWSRREHLRVTCRRCGYARVEDVGAGS